MDSVLTDFRHAILVLRARPGLVLASMLSLGLGLGVNLTLFSFVRSALFFQPDVANPERVVGVEPGRGNQFSYLNYRDLQDSDTFEAVAGFRRVPLNVRVEREVDRVEGLAVTANFFDALGVRAALGRTFATAEAAPEREPRVVVLSHTFWQRRFGGNQGVIGSPVTIDGQPFDIIGVLAQGYRPVTPRMDPGIYVPLSTFVLPTINDRNNGNSLNVLGLLRPNSSRQQAQTAVTVLGQRLAQAYPEQNAGMELPARVVPLRVREFGGWQQPVFISAVLFLLVGLVLLSACANIAGLLLARSAQRQREIAMRVALGATRGRLIRMLLTESLGLAVVGALTGAVLFVGLTRALSNVALPALLGSVNLQLGIDAGVIIYALALTLLTGVLCGLIPALRVTRTNVVSEVARAGQSSTGRLWARHVFVVGQVAASMILLVLSSLLLLGLTRVTTLDPGFDIDRVAVAMVNVEASRYAMDGGLVIGERLVERVAALPGVETASFAGIVALSMNQSSTFLQVQGVPPGSVGSRAFVNSVSPRYFDTLGIPLVSGRDFDPSDREGAPSVAIVSEAFARAYFPGQNALGKRVRRLGRDQFSEIIGIVRDSKYGSVAEDPAPILYAAYAQDPRISTEIRPVVIHVRTVREPTAIVRELRRVIVDLAPAASVRVQTLRDATSAEAQLRGFGTWMIGTLGSVALLLAMIGLYGTIAFVVSSRTREIGLRMALGASSRLILGNVVAQGVRLMAIGIAIGSVVAWMLARALAAALAGLSSADPVAYGSATLILFLVGLTAIYFPARRAAALNPVEALRVP